MIWQAQGRDAVFVPPDVGGSVRIGAIDWVEAISQNSAEGCISVAIGNGNYAPYGSFSASRTSDGGGIADMALAYQDVKVSGGGAWGRYTEAFVAADAHHDNTIFGHEYGIINKRDSCADITPYRISQWGIVDGVRIGVGKPGAGGREISSMGTFANVEGTVFSVARKGLIFAYDAIKMVAHLGRKLGEVLSLAKGHGIRWYDAVGLPGTTIQCNVDNALFAPHIEFTNGAVHFLDAKGVSQFSFNTETGVPYYGNTAYAPTPLPQCPGSIGTLHFYVGGKPVKTPIYPA